MKIIISYPPLDTRKGCPTLGQNRQFQYFREPTYIYPVVPASAATALARAGHEVVWNDCLAGGNSYAQFIGFIRHHQPDIIAFETKTPVIKQHWRIINDLKERFPYLRCVLFGDHVTALPEESLRNCEVDFILTGGDYDFLLVNLCNCLSWKVEGGRWKEENYRHPSTFDLRPSTSLEPGIYYRDGNQIKYTGRFQLDHDLNTLPFIDRELTQWRLYAARNGNYKRTPGAYIMSGRDCWWGKCVYCSWPALYPEFRVRSTGNVLDEVGSLIERYRVREIMDDTGCFPAGEWLRAFCNGMITRGYHRKIYFDCNMRFGALSGSDFRLMKKANFRLLLFGLESASQTTLDRINKNVKVERIITDCKTAREAGLFPHITIMFGYPWESYEDGWRTLELGRWLLRKGYAYTMQATVVIPYPGTKLFDECQDNGWLKSLDWDEFDMKKPVMNSAAPDEKVMELVRQMYKVSFSPEFILRKLINVRDIDDLRYFGRAARKIFGHIFDFRNNAECAGSKETTSSNEVSIPSPYPSPQGGGKRG